MSKKDGTFDHAIPDANGIRPFANSIRIEAVPPSNNIIKKTHWAVYARIRKQFAYLISLRTVMFDFSYPIKMRVQINIHSKGARARRLDSDNLWGGCKPLIDAMRDVRLIHNDSPKWLDLGVCEIRDDGPYTCLLYTSPSPRDS